MRAVRVEGPGAVRVVDVEAPAPGSGEVVVDVAFAGICGSDVELVAGRRPAEFVRYPVVPGHEWSGVVAEVGEGVDAGMVGRSVVGDGFRGCGACDPCGRGESLLCETAYDEIGFTRPGAWAEQLLIPAGQLYLLGTGADLRSAAGLEPAACAAEAVACAAPQAGDRIAVVGAGTIGALVIQLLRSANPAEVVVIEPNVHRAAVAHRCGASSALVPDEAHRVAGRFDVVIEAAGARGAARLALELVTRGGRIVLAGIPDADATLPVLELVSRRATVATVFGAPRRAWQAAVAAFDAGALDPGLLVTHTVDLADIDAGLRLVASRDGAVGKVLVSP